MGNIFSKKNCDVMSDVLCFKNKYSCECGSVGESIFLHQPKLTFIPAHTAILLLLVFSLLNVVQSATQIVGTVLDADSKAPLKNALVALKSTGDLVLTDESGKFSISPAIVINHTVIRGESTNSINLKKGVLSLYVEKQNSKIELKTYTLTGKQISSLSYTLSKGSHSIAVSNLRSAAGTILCKLKVNAQLYTFPLTATLSYTITPARCNSVAPTRSNDLATSVVDTLIVSKYLYTPITTSVTATIYLKKPDTLPPPPGMKAIPGGKYMRGSTHTLSDNDEQPVKEITISNFFMDSTEVTQADFQALLNVQPWVNVAILGKGNNYPTWKINWFDAIYYCNARSKRDGIDTVYKFDSVSGIPGNGCIIYNVLTDFGKKGYRLPTESEWEYAARGGAVTEYYWGNYSKNDLITPKKYAWYDTNSAQPVAMKIPNNFGMYDMAGNVMEYANDYYHVNSYDSDEITDPKGVSSSEYKVLRGGYWYGAIGDVRPAERVGLKPKDAYNPHGFRVAHPYYK